MIYENYVLEDGTIKVVDKFSCIEELLNIEPIKIVEVLLELTEEEQIEKLNKTNKSFNVFYSLVNLSK